MRCSCVYININCMHIIKYINKYICHIYIVIKNNRKCVFVFDDLKKKLYNFIVLSYLKFFFFFFATFAILNNKNHMFCI